MDYNLYNFIDIIKLFLRNVETFKDSSTIKLLLISFFVSLSGFFRIYIASIIQNSNINLSICFAGGLIIYAVYTLDRVLDHDERFIEANQSVGLFVSLLASIIGFYIFFKNGLFEYAILPFLIGYIYNKKIVIGKHTLKLKGSHGMKNLVVGSTWGLFIAGTARFTNAIPFIIVIILYGAKTFINSTLNDFKDVNADSLSGIKTLPVSLGSNGTRKLLLGIFILSHLILGIAMIYEIINVNIIIFSCSFVCGLFCVLNCLDAQSNISRFFRDGEAVITVILLSLLNIVSM